MNRDSEGDYIMELVGDPKRHIACHGETPNEAVTRMVGMLDLVSKQPASRISEFKDAPAVPEETVCECGHSEAWHIEGQACGYMAIACPCPKFTPATPSQPQAVPSKLTLRQENGMRAEMGRLEAEIASLRQQIADAEDKHDASCGYQIWTHGFVPNTTISTPVIRSRTIYLNKADAERAQTMFDDKTYLVEYPIRALKRGE